MVNILEGFIAFEGIDGAGTTTQAGLLSERLKSNKTPFLSTCEPTQEPIGRLIRSVLKGEIHLHPYSLAHLFASDRHEHLYAKGTGIVDRVTRGEQVFTDRYLFSSLAYQSVDCGFEQVLSLNSNFPLPQCVFYLEISAEEGHRRSSSRGPLEIFEHADFLRRVLQLYDKTFAHFVGTGMDIYKIDGTQSQESIHEKICTILGI